MPRKDPRNYGQEYADYHGKPKQIANRATRNAAVAKLDRKGKSTTDGREVDHKEGVSKGNARSNLRVVSKLTNRRKG